MRAFTTLVFAASAAAQILNTYPRLSSEDKAYQPLSILSKRATSSPCGEVAERWAASKANLKPGAKPSIVRVPAQAAYDCLMSVPVDVEGDVLEIDELKAFLQWQSTLAWLKTGVKDIIEPQDIMKNLDSLASAVKSNTTYKSDYEVQLSIRKMLDAVGDFHLQYLPDITNVFLFARPGGELVSLSNNGMSIPGVYFTSDLPKQIDPRLESSELRKMNGSEVRKINGRDATLVLEEYSNGTIYHDADTRYNTVFANPALSAAQTGTAPLSVAHYIYPGPTTNYTFANGTVLTLENIAIIAPSYDFTNVTDGLSFFEAFCTGFDQPAVLPAPSPTSNTTAPANSSAIASATPKASPSLVGYPKPEAIHPSKFFSAYYLDGNDYNDTAVISLPSFNIQSTDPKFALPLLGGFVEVQALLRKFLTHATKKNKKKLIIDLRGNGGGTIDLAFELFKQLFPTIEPYGASRFRASEAFHYISALVADVAVDGVDKDGKIDNIDNWADADYGLQSTFLWSNILDNNNTGYKTYRDYYGPETINGDQFSSIRRYNFSNNVGGHTLPANITGYNGLTNVTAQPFQADNIVLLQDGLCGSACAIFSELMKEQGKVQTVVIGGRPLNAPMQGVGGTKGSQLIPFDSLVILAQQTIETAEDLNGAAVAQQLNETSVGTIYQATQMYQRTAPNPEGKLSGGVNSQNNQRRNDSSNTPLQFYYEAADCRLFYSLATYLDPVNLWKRTADSKWLNKACVPGSMAEGFGPKNNGTEPLQSPTSAASSLKSRTALVLAAVVAIAMIL